MFRVVTKYTAYQKGLPSRTIHRGPWHPSESVARYWAAYCETAGIYEAVEVESNEEDSKSRKTASTLNQWNLNND